MTSLQAWPEYSPKATMFWKEQALFTGKNGAEARQAVGGSGGPVELRLIG